MPFVQGFLRVRRGSGGEIDNELPGGGGGEIDNSLPGGQGGVIDNTLPIPEPPPGIWPPPSLGRPIVPVDPGFGVGGRPGIDNSLPVTPGTIWPSPGRPNRPDQGLPPGRPNRPDQGLPPAPARPGQGLPPGGEIDNTLPSGGGGRPDNSLPSQTFWMLCYCPTLGWKYIAVDPSLEVGYPLPPAAQPK